MADGLRVSLRDLTWHFVSSYLTDILLATEEEIIDAVRLVWERMKLVIEPSSAVAVAAIVNNPELFRSQQVGVIVTGGNVDTYKLPWLSH